MIIDTYQKSRLKGESVRNVERIDFYGEKIVVYVLKCFDGNGNFLGYDEKMLQVKEIERIRV